jgi:hypothetical protein
MKQSRMRGCVLAITVLLPAARAGATVSPLLSSNLVLNTLQPCRIVDTRISGTPLVAGTATTFNVVGSTLNVPTPQGGQAGGCGIPGFSGSTPGAQAVVINFVAVGATGVGDLVVWPSDKSQPLASVLNYAQQSALAGLNIANGIVMPLRQDAQGGDITVLAQVSGTHLVADVVGYFTASVAQYGYIYNLTAESVPAGTDVVFDSNGILTPGIAHSASTSSIVVNDPGVYKVTFSVSAAEPNQFAVVRNNVPVVGSTYGSGAGTQQNTGFVVVTLAAGDVVTLRNQSTVTVTLQQPTGGTSTNVNASILIEKLPP